MDNQSKVRKFQNWEYCNDKKGHGAELVDDRNQRFDGKGLSQRDFGEFVRMSGTRWHRGTWLTVKGGKVMSRVLLRSGVNQSSSTMVPGIEIEVPAHMISIWRAVRVVELKWKGSTVMVEWSCRDAVTLFGGGAIMNRRFDLKHERFSLKSKLLDGWPRTVNISRTRRCVIFKISKS